MSVVNPNKRLFSIISPLNPYSTFTSLLTISNLLDDTSNPISKIFLCSDDFTIFNKKLIKYLERKTEAKIELIQMPELNELLISKNTLELGIENGDFIDLRPGSSIHSAFILNEIIKKNISPILLIPSSRGDRIHVTEIGIDGHENSASHQVLGIGDLHAFMLSMCRNDEFYEKKEISSNHQNEDLILKLESFCEVEKNPTSTVEELRLMMKEILTLREIKSIGLKGKDSKYGFYYEEIAKKIIINFLNLNKDNLEHIEFFMNVEQKINLSHNKTRGDTKFREEDILCRIGTQIIIISMKFWSSRRRFESELEEESKRVSGLFNNNMPKESIHKFIINPQSLEGDKEYFDVKHLRINQFKIELNKLVEKYLDPRRN